MIFLFIYLFIFLWIRYYFAENRQNLCLTVKIWAFLVADTFINERVFFAQILLLCRKSAKFVTKCENMKFSQRWHFYKCGISLHKYSYFAKNRQNSRLIVKVWTFLWAIFQRKIFVYLNMLLFYWRSAKFAIFCVKCTRWTFLGGW